MSGTDQLEGRGLRDMDKPARPTSSALKRVSSMRPPRIALIAMIILHLMLPLAIIVPAPFSYIGVATIAAGVAMIVWSRRAFQAAATPITPFTESTALIRDGLYRWSRNPMYLRAVLFVSGWPFCAAARLRSWWRPCSSSSCRRRLSAAKSVS